MGTFGFSYVGFVLLLMLFVPNFLWTHRKPEGYEELERTEPKPLLFLERLGQGLVTTAALVFSDFNLHPLSLWSLWLAAAFACMLLYEACWVRYFAGERTLGEFYGKCFGVPVPLATLPVAAFFLLGVYGRVIWMLLATLVLGVGHIGIHLRHEEQIRK